MRIIADNIKIAQTEYPVMDIIKNRWSPRSFSDKAIPAKELHTIVEAAAWSFSAMNEQPWRYIAAHKGTELFDKLFSLLKPGNQAWGKDAAVLMLSIGNKVYVNSGVENNNMAYDVGASNMLLTLQANSMGIYTHVIEGFEKDKAKELLQLDDQLVPVVMIALGYPDEADKLPEPFRTREITPRSRKPINEILLNYEN